MPATRTAHCDYCDTDYTTATRAYRGKGVVFVSCDKAECVTACSAAYTAERERVEAERAAVRAATPRRPRQQPQVCGEWGMVALLCNPELAQPKRSRRG
jgi:hypothetical protein